MNKESNKRQVGGEHYRTNSGMQHWDMVIDQDLNYFEGQITKYVMRARRKNGMQDLQKAQHFLEKYIEEWPNIHRIPAETIRVLPRTQQDKDDEFKLQQEAAAFFQTDGFSGDGSNGYQCVKCRQVIRAKSPLSAFAAHTGHCPMAALPAAVPTPV